MSEGMVMAVAVLTNASRYLKNPELYYRDPLGQYSTRERSTLST